MIQGDYDHSPRIDPRGLASDKLPEGIDTEFGNFVYRSRMALLARQSIMSAMATILAIGIFYALTDTSVDKRTLLAFSISMATVAVIRFVFALWARGQLADSNETLPLRRWYKLEFLLVSVVGFGWAVGAWVGLRNQAPESQLYLVVFLLGVSSLVALGYALFIEMFAVVSLPIIIVIMVVLFERFVPGGDVRPLTLGLGMLAYGSLLVVYARRYQKVARDMYEALAALREVNSSLSNEHKLLLAATELAQRTALLDPLTGLPNRLCLAKEACNWLAECRASGAEFVVGFIDLARFKSINDQFGHQIGDLVIVRTAELIRKTIRESDLATRVGGDEFVVLLKADCDQIDPIRERLRKQMASFPIAELDGKLVGANLGFAQFPADGDSLDELLRVADSRMYSEKFGKTCPSFMVLPSNAA